MKGNMKRNVRKRKRILEDALGHKIDYTCIFKRSKTSAKGWDYHKSIRPLKTYKRVPPTHIFVTDTGKTIACPTAVDGYVDLMVDKMSRHEPASNFGPSRAPIRKHRHPIPDAYNINRDQWAGSKILRTVPDLEENDWVRIFWPSQLAWFRAQVTDLSPCIVVRYEDGEKEWLSCDSIFRLENDRTERPEDKAPLMIGYAKLEKPQVIPSVWNAKDWIDADGRRLLRQVEDKPIHIFNRADFSWTTGIVKEPHQSGWLLVAVKCSRGKMSEHWVDPTVNECYISDDNGKKWKKREITVPRRGPRVKGLRRQAMTRKRSITTSKGRRHGLRHKKSGLAFKLRLPKPLHELSGNELLSPVIMGEGSPYYPPSKRVKTIRVKKEKKDSRKPKKKKRKKKSESGIYIPPSRSYRPPPIYTIPQVDIPRVNILPTPGRIGEQQKELLPRPLRIPQLDVVSPTTQFSPQPVSKEDCVFDANYNSKQDNWDQRRDGESEFFGVFKEQSKDSWGMRLQVSSYYRMKELGFATATAAAYARDKAILHAQNTCPENKELHKMALNFPHHKNLLLKQLQMDPNARTHPNRIYMARHDLKSPFRPIQHPSRDPPEMVMTQTPHSRSSNGNSARTLSLDSQTDLQLTESSLFQDLSLKKKEKNNFMDLMQPGTLFCG